MIVVVVPASQGSDCFRVVGDVFANQSLFSMCTVQALEPSIRLRMRDPGQDITSTSERHERSPLAADELAAMIMYELRLTGAPALELLQRLLHR